MGDHANLVLLAFQILVGNFRSLCAGLALNFNDLCIGHLLNDKPALFCFYCSEGTWHPAFYWQCHLDVSYSTCQGICMAVALNYTMCYSKRGTEDITCKSLNSKDKSCHDSKHDETKTRFSFSPSTLMRRNLQIISLSLPLAWCKPINNMLPFADNKFSKILEIHWILWIKARGKGHDFILLNMLAKFTTPSNCS